MSNGNGDNYNLTKKRIIPFGVYTCVHA